LKINDTLAGFLCLIGAVVLWINARGLPNPANQPVGPGAFPALIAVLLGMVALYLIWGGLRTSPRTPLLTLSDWTRQPMKVGRFLLIPAAVALYIATVDVVGFIPLMFAILVTLLIACAVRPLATIAIAVFVTLFVHTIFYGLLKVQLPWGLLDAVRW
jgi:putative tricarboxylic transport membrane protein